jgi:hypothetical protein
MSDSHILDLAQRLWPAARDRGTVDDPNDLDTLLASQGQPGAPGIEDGLLATFAAFTLEQDANDFALPTGERPSSDAEGRFLAHVLVTRVLLAVGLDVDPRVADALAAGHALSWAVTSSEYLQGPLGLAAALWLPALDPDSASDRPLAIDWGAPLFADVARWDPEYRPFSHYDARERALDWAVYATARAERREGVSIFTLIEPLLRMERDQRAGMAIAAIADTADPPGSAPAPAAAMLERRRIADLLRTHQAAARDA